MLANASRKPFKWHGSGQCVNIRGYEIAGGLMYVGTALPGVVDGRNDACLINPELETVPAEPGDWVDEHEMAYYPEYAGISPRCRGAYLQWLADGRDAPTAYIGYVFLFFYGLERRLLLDVGQGEVSEQERAEVVGEVRRLLEIYGDNRSFRIHARRLLAVEWILHRSKEPAPDGMDRAKVFQTVLARQVADGRPVLASEALDWLDMHPEFGLPDAARHHAKKFATLFHCRYKQRFGEGMLVQTDGEFLTFKHSPASPSLQGGLSLQFPRLPDAFNQKSLLQQLDELAQECSKALEPYCRAVSRRSSEWSSLAALALLPNELICQALEPRNAQTRLEQVCAKGLQPTSAADLWRCLGEEPPRKIGKKELEILAALVEGLGFGMVPNARLHGIWPDCNGTAAIFLHVHGLGPWPPSKEFRLAAAIVRLGAMVVKEDDSASPAGEAMLLTAAKDSRLLNLSEQESLHALLIWCLDAPRQQTGITNLLEDAAADEKSAIGRMLASAACADGRIVQKKISLLETLYPLLGLTREQVAADLHALTAANGPVTIGRRDPHVDFLIPLSETDDAKEFRLNNDRVRAIEAETHQVQGVLGGIFADQAEEATEDEGSAVQTASALAVLDQAHQDLFHRLLRQEAWDRAELNELCNAFGLMPDGALEVLNEWAFNSANVLLIEDGDPVHVDVNLAKEIMNA